MAIANQWEDARFYRNDAPDPGAFLGLHVLLSTSGGTRVHAGHPTPQEGSPAVGAFVTVHLPDDRALVRQVDLSNGHTGGRSPDLLFGLGRADVPARVTADVDWRDRTGHLHHDTFTLEPGWHTLVLGGSP